MFYYTLRREKKQLNAAVLDYYDLHLHRISPSFSNRYPKISENNSGLFPRLGTLSTRTFKSFNNPIKI
jgi:hypothetical protein